MRKDRNNRNYHTTRDFTGRAGNYQKSAQYQRTLACCKETVTKEEDMVIQKDQETLFATGLSRGRATDLLYGPLEEAAPAPERTETASRFNYNHDTTDFDRLVNQKYSGSFADIDRYTETANSADNFSAPPVFERYNAHFAETLEDAPAPAPTYETPVFEKYRVDRTEYAQPTEAPQQYFNDKNPMPYQTFRPRIFDFEVHEFDTGRGADLEQIAEVDVVAETENLTAPTMETPVRVTEQSFFQPKLRLNAKGIIAVVAFFAIVAMITVLIIVNSIAVGTNRSRISALRMENSTLSAEYSDATRARDQAYQNGVDFAEKNIIKDSPDYNPAPQYQDKYNDFEKIDVTPIQ
jgi:hypothetical protein